MDSAGYDVQDNENVYELIRGAPTVIITRSVKDSEEYRPKWLGKIGGEEHGMGYNEEPWVGTGHNSPVETQSFVTLMISKKKDDEKDYRPKRKVEETKEDEVESVSDTSSESTSAKTKEEGRHGDDVDKTKRTKNK